MLELAADLVAELRAGRRIAAVTVVGMPGRAPRGVGAAMALTEDGRVIGSVSSGCVDGDCVLLAGAALSTGRASSARFGFGDVEARAAGLACGGSVDVVACVVSPQDSLAVNALDEAAHGRATRLVLALDGADGARALPAQKIAMEVRPSGEAGSVAAAVVPSEHGELLVLARARRPGLVLIGANEHAAALCRVAAAVGYEVTVCDPWETLVTRDRFPDAAALVADLPHVWLAELDGLDPADTAVCVLSHDERIDVPALRVALERSFAFVGAMGSRATTSRRRELLRAGGVPAAAVDSIRMPLGLDLGGAEPGETALAILAEIVVVRRGGTAAPLSTTVGPIHRTAADGSVRVLVEAIADPAYC